jgi:hypothetical protein
VEHTNNSIANNSNKQVKRYEIPHKFYKEILSSKLQSIAQRCQKFTLTREGAQMSSPRKHPNVNKKKSNNQKIILLFRGAKWEEKSKYNPTYSSSPSFPSSLISLPCFRSPHTTSPQNPNLFHSTQKDSARQRAGRIDPPKTIRSAKERRRLSL